MGMLPPEEFCRCQRSIVVNVRKIKSMAGKKEKELLLTNGETLRVGPKYIENVKIAIMAKI